MDIFTTSVSTTIASIAIVVTSIFGGNVAPATTVTNAPSSTSVQISEIENVAYRHVQEEKAKPKVVCASGGLVPANAPECPKK